MIAFFADNHFGARPGYELWQRLRHRDEIIFHEDSLEALPELLANEQCELLILNWISDTGSNPHPGEEIERPLKQYLESGRPLFLIHGASAAFAQWTWWRDIVGLRWVRPNDPDGFAPSTHPLRPYGVRVSKTRHPLARQLQAFDLPEDEIYIHLEQTCPLSILMETHTEEGTFPQAYLTETPWHGQIGAFIPGHRSTAFENPALLANVEALIEYLRAPRTRS